MKKKKVIKVGKFNYPSEGIYYNCKNYTAACSKYLSGAINNCYLDIPEDFKYYSYLAGLKDTLNNYKREIDDIDLKILSSDKKYSTLTQDLVEDIKKKDFKDIKSRDRMII